MNKEVTPLVRSQVLGHKESHFMKFSLLWDLKEILSLKLENILTQCSAK